jgi:prepilin-type N-terminal cleavage/methylation domain-containing protein
MSHIPYGVLEVPQLLGCEADRRSTDAAGFTLAEIMFVVVIVGIMIAIALPVLATTVAMSERKTCFANQRTIESAVEMWELQSENPKVSDLAGLVTAGHPIISGPYLKRPPTCPSAPRPTDPNNPTAAEGAYTLDSSATVLPCPFGPLGPHGSFHKQ